MKSIEIEGFRFASKYNPSRVISVDGYVNGNPLKLNINTSSIWTKLIHEAGRLCDRFASDLLIDYGCVQTWMHTSPTEGKVFLFGFREDGVDNKTFVISSCRELSQHYLRCKYRSLWVLECHIEDCKLTMELWEAGI